MDRIAMAGHLIRRLHQQSTQTFQAGMQAIGVDMTSVQFAALPAGLGFLVLIPVLSGSVYSSYRDIFLAN